MKKNKKEVVKAVKGELEAYMPLVHSIASMVSGKGLPPNIEYDDLVSDGTIGLMKAWENFDSGRGVKFETYASYRVRGEILDGLKNYSPVPYRVQVMIRNLAKDGVKGVISNKGKNEELLEKKELSEDEFRHALKRIKKIVSASALMYLLSIQEMSEAGTEAQVASDATPASELDFAELKVRIRDEINNLPKQQRQVLEMFFRGGVNQKTIAKKLDLSRPKVCRLLNKATEILRKRLK